MKEKVNIFWFRRDLRLEDNVGFSKALQGKYPVLPIFIFDTAILEELPKDDARVSFLHENLIQMNEELKSHGSSIGMFFGKPEEVYKKILAQYNVQNVITNRDYEPYATARDSKISELLKNKDVGFYTYKDHVIFEKDDVLKSDGTPYRVYTPYMKTWKAKFRNEYQLKIHESSTFYSNLFKAYSLPKLSLTDIGFIKSPIRTPSYNVSKSIISNYEDTRNFPAIDGTSKLGPHLRFGTVSIRKMVQRASSEKNEVFWQELIWREFFIHILWHFPHSHKNSFKPQYDRIEWRNKEDEFEKWKLGKTGYVLVDAGIRELNATGYMHNRVRMLVASFLCKHLLIDWRWGEAYFAEKLLDYELASNVGNWQWACGSGVDAAPYFRIFNPITQAEKFDKSRQYIKKWVPEVDTTEYVKPMVDHKFARERCLKVYKNALN